MADLSENDIKKVALNLLQQHYRFRPRGGPTTLQYDLRAEGGIIIDGCITFPREGADAPPFVATVEATSRDTHDEVRYRVQQGLLAWDATAVAALLTALLLTAFHGKGYYPLIELGLLNALLLAAGLLAAGHLLYRIFFSNLQRYRFIYAVEQFKNYYADEQWVAVGENVFRGKEDKYFKELRDQCIFQGFGLIIVDTDKQGHKYVTPSRNDLFEGRRKRLRFQTLEEFSRRLPVALPAGKKTKLIGPAPRATVKRRRSWMRDPFRYFHQFTVLLVGATLIATIYFLQWQERPVLVVNEAAYDQRLLEEKVRQEMEAEPLGFLTDSGAVPPFRSRVEPYLRLEPERPVQPGPVRTPPGILAIDNAGRVMELPCSRARSRRQTRYVLELRGLDYQEPLVDLLRRLRADNIRVVGLWLGCFTPATSDYALVLIPFYNSRQRAERALPAAERFLEEAGYPVRLSLRTLPAGG